MEKMTRRAFLKGVALLPLLSLASTCEQKKETDTLKKDIATIIKKLKENQPQTSIVTTAEGDKFRITLYSQKFVLSNKQTIDVAFAIPQPISNPHAKGDPTLTIESAFKTNDGMRVFTFIDVNANGFRKGELDQFTSVIYIGNKAIVDQNHQMFQQENLQMIQQLNRNYANVVNQVKSKLMEQSLV